MSVGSTYTQLVLFDGNNIKDQEWFDKVKDFTKIPSSCKLWIFCNEADTDMEKSFELVKNSQVLLHKSSDHVIEMFNTLHHMRFTYSFILVVCDKNANYACNLNKITKEHENISVMQIDPCNVNVKDIIHKVDYQEIKAPKFSYRRSAATLSSKDDLPRHSEDEHDLQTQEDKDQLDHLKKTSNNKNSRLGDQYKNDLYCLICSKSFHTKHAQNKHIKAGHPDAKSDDDDDNDYE